jgi:hypothetical protein
MPLRVGLALLAKEARSVRQVLRYVVHCAAMLGPFL